MTLLENDILSVSITPRVGGTITDIRHKPSGLSVLGRVPWLHTDEPLPAAAQDEAEWLTRYTGGWPLLFPNAGDACTVDGVFHGFHGEASVSPWDVMSSNPTALHLEHRFAVIPARMRRTITLVQDTLSIHEELAFTGNTSTDIMWGHHPSFGGDLLDGPVEITSGARDVRIEPIYAPPEGANLMRPSTPFASLAYLEGFQEPWAMIRRRDDAIAVHLTWDATRFPCAWLWHELEATSAAPYAGCTRLLAIEPCTTPCALGLAEAKRRGLPLLRLDPGQSYTGHIALRVFQPTSQARLT